MSNAPVTTGVNRVLIVARDARDIIERHAGIVAAVARRQHKVLCLVGALDAASRVTIEAAGGVAEAVILEASGFNPFGETLLRRRLASLISAYDPRVTVALDVPTAGLILPLARKAGVPRTLAMISALPEGLAEGLADVGAESKPVRLGAKTARDLERLFAAATDVVLHQSSDLRARGRLPWLKAETRVWSGTAAGLDLVQHCTLPLPPINGDLTCLMATGDLSAADLQWVADTARHMAKSGAKVRLRVVADSVDSGSTAQKGLFSQPAGSLDVAIGRFDLADELNRCHVVIDAAARTTPSATLLAALAAGRPVIAVDTEANRCAVDEVVNGWLVPRHDALALAAIIASMDKRRSQLAALARASRHKAERRYDQRAIDRHLLAVLDLDGIETAA